MRVPPRNWPKPYTLEHLTVVQERFYRLHFKPGVVAGDPLRIDADSVYPMTLAHEVLSEYDENPVLAERLLRVLLVSYGNGRYSYSLKTALHDIDLLEGRWQKRFDEGSARVQARLLLAFPVELATDRVTAAQVFSWSMVLTKTTISFLNLFGEILQADLDRFHDEHGVSMLQDFWNTMTSEAPAETIAEAMRGRIGVDLQDEAVVWMVNHYRQEGRRSSSDWTAFREFDRLERAIPGLENAPMLDAFEPVWRQYVKQFTRAAENTVREINGLPLVGEKNVSETKLLRELQTAFPEETVLHQVRPRWLAPQSLDIVFARRNVAVEYQGVQHSRPVELFGGADGFALQQQRDENKRRLCEANGMMLVEVFPNYRISDVVRDVKVLLDAIIDE